MKTRIGLTSLLVIGIVAIVGAHITIGPVESKLGASERYTVRVPTEGQVATVGVDLEIPEGVTVSYVMAHSGWTSELKRVDKRVTGIIWTVAIPPAHFGELVFNARNPKEGTAIAWKIKQRFADGTSSDWTASTKLVPPADTTR